MSFLDLALKRVSVRGYDTTPITEDDLNKVLEAGRLAPTAANRQPLHFIVVREDQKRTALSEAKRQDWFTRAPVVIVVCVDSAKAWVRSDGKNFGEVDAAIAMDHMTLCAADIGLGTCWIAAFDPGMVKRVLGLPPGIEPLAMTPLGKPADRGVPKKRKGMDELVHYENWQGQKQIEVVGLKS